MKRRPYYFACAEYIMPGKKLYGSCSKRCHMKILILANNDLGLYRFRKELITELLQEHEVNISVPYGEMVDPLIRQGCILYDTSVDRRGINPVTDLKLLRRYGKIIDEIRPDLVITYTIKPNIYGGLACSRRKVPYAVNVTGLGAAFQKKGILQQMVTMMYRISMKKARVVFVENSEIGKTLAIKRIISDRKIRVLNGAGVNLDDFAYADYPENEVFSFLFIGRVMKAKGIDELLEAVQRLNEEGLKCVLHLVGYLEENYVSEIRRGCREGWLVDHGMQKDVRPFIAAADCFVLPSWHEGMANTNLESAASGRPVITTDIPGCREAVLNGKTGLLCEPRNADSLCSAMRRMRQTPREERARMGMAGRRHMEEKFDKKIVVRETMRWLF